MDTLCMGSSLAFGARATVLVLTKPPVAEAAGRCAHVAVSRRDHRRLRHGLKGADEGVHGHLHLIALSLLKLSLDGADADMSKCLRKTVLVQNVLRRSSPTHSPSRVSSAARGHSQRPRADQEYDEAAESVNDDPDDDHDDDSIDDDDDDDGSSTRFAATGAARRTIIGEVVSHGFAKPPSATSAGVISLVLRPPTPPPPRATSGCPSAPSSFALPSPSPRPFGKLPGNLGDVQDEDAEEVEDVDSLSPPPTTPLGNIKLSLTAFVALDPDVQVVPTDDGTVSPQSPLTPASIINANTATSRRRSLAQVLEDAGSPPMGNADAVSASPTKRARAHAAHFGALVDPSSPGSSSPSASASTSEVAVMH